MTAARSPPKGVYVPVPTFFKPASATPDTQPELDLQAQIQHSVFLAKSGIRGLVLLGSTGEAIHLTGDERRALVSSCRKGLQDAGYDDYPIMAGVLTNGIDETLEWLKDYAEAGAQWGLVLAPGYFGKGASQENLRAWFETVANRSPLPILIYNYPGVTNGVVVEADTYSQLAQHPNIVGCKMSHGDVSLHVQVSTDPSIDHDKFRVYSGFGQQLGPIVLFGAAGVIDGLSAFYPKTVVRLMELATQTSMSAEALSEARRLQHAVSRAEEYIGKTGVLGIREGVIRVAGIGGPGGRLPLAGRTSEGDWTALSERYLAEIDKIEKSLS